MAAENQSLQALNTDDLSINHPIVAQPTSSVIVKSKGDCLDEKKNINEKCNDNQATLQQTCIAIQPNHNNNFVTGPTGLEYLAAVDQLIIKQQFAVLEVLIDWECANKYKIFNTVGQQCFFALEESNICCRQCCRTARSLTMHITDTSAHDVILVERPFHCMVSHYCMACCSCCQDKVKVMTPSGEPLGFVYQRCSLIRLHLVVCDGDEVPLYEIVGPVCAFSCCGSIVRFPVTEISTGEKIGEVGKLWTGVLKEAFSDSDNFGLTFPLSLDPRLKATLLGAVFLIDFMLFENEDKGQAQEAVTAGAGAMFAGGS